MKVVVISPMVHNWVVRYAADLVVADIEEFEKHLETSPNPVLRD
jgi:hypothetical protein